MKKIQSIFLTFTSMALLISCTEQPYWNIPKDANGNAIITQVSKTTSPGITALDGGFTIEAYLPNARPGDVMTAELVKPQVPEWDPDGATQILPVQGSKKTATVDADLNISVSYTKAEATLANVGDYVTVTLAGPTDSGIKRIDLKSAFAVTKPVVGGKEVTIIRTPEVANIEVKVTPSSAAYTGDIVAKRKNGANGTWEDVPAGSYSVPQPYIVPVAGSDFVASDTMYYSFVATTGGNTEEYTTSVVVVDPYFFLQKKGVTLAVGGASTGRNLLTNTAVAENNAAASIAANVSSGSLLLQAGSAFTGTTEFVPSTLAAYTANDAEQAKADFAAGTPTATADPNAGEGVYIFRIVNGADPEDVYYGFIRVVSVVPGSSVTLEYRIGDQYAHMSVIK
jgi:hypothetical protein